MEELWFRVLGPLEATRGENRIDLGSPRQRTVLAVLLATPNRVISTDRLVDEIWGEDAPAKAVHSLQTYVSNLRRLLSVSGPGKHWIETRRPGYLIRIKPDELDAAEFTNLVRQAKDSLSADPAETALLLRRALGLWRGAPFAGMADEVPILQAEAASLEELRLTALELRVEADLALGEHAALVPELDRLVSEHPLRERFWAALMMALYRSGRQADALKAYQTARRFLGEQLGIEPSAELKELEERILLQDPELNLVAKTAPQHNLPAQISSFVGRERELSEITELIGESRLVTVTGAGGSGKTRLALQVAAETLDEYPDGVWLVELAPVTDPDLVTQTVGMMLGVREQPNYPILDTLLGVLREKELLLVVDNCEHLVDAAAQLVSSLLGSCPQLRIVATTRETLGVPGEVPYRVRSLAVPDPSHLPSLAELTRFDAVRLFAERGKVTRPGFRVTAENAGAVVQVCCRLDGMPLAIELAAARLRMLSPEQIATRLDDRFQLLTGGVRTAVPRQQTLQAAIDWSYDLLSDQEQTLFCRLSVFQGGFTFEAAEQVGAGDDIETVEVLDLLSHLVDKSLVVAEDEPSGAVRYRLLETLRQFGRDKVARPGEADEARPRHAAFFVALAEEAEPQLRGPDQVTWLERLEKEQDNLRAAQAWFLDADDPEAGLRLAGALSEFWYMSGYWSEARRWLDSALSEDGRTSPALRVKALLGPGRSDLVAGPDPQRAAALADEALALSRQLGDKRGIAGSLRLSGTAAGWQHDVERATTLLEEALTLFRELGDRPGIADSLTALGNAVWWRDHERATALLEESLTLNRKMGDKWGIASSLGSLARFASREAHYERATALFEESLSLSRELGSKESVGHTLMDLGHMALLQGDQSRAAPLLEEGLVLLREVGDEHCVAKSLRHLGMVAHHQRAQDRAAALFRESLRMRQEVEDKPNTAESLEGLGRVACAEGQLQRAAGLFGAAEALRQAAGLPMPLSERSDYEPDVAAVRAGLDEKTFNRAWAEGRAMPLEEAIAHALEETG